MKIKDHLRSIDIVISRAKKTGFAVIIATSTDKTDDVFEEIAKEHNVQLFRGALVNKIKRWYDCFQKFKIEVEQRHCFMNGTTKESSDLKLVWKLADHIIGAHGAILRCGQISSVIGRYLSVTHWV